MATVPFSGVVYLHYNPISEKGYVGQTARSLSQRWAEHVKHAKAPKSPTRNTPFARSIRKYGPEAFESQILSIASSKADLDNLEKVWVILLQTREIGYNIASGGEGNPGVSPTEETKAKIRQNRKGKGLGNKNALGTVQTPEMRKQKSDANRGRKFSVDHKEKIRNALLGVKRPDVSAANNLRWGNPDTRKKQSEIQKALGAHLLVRDAHGHIVGRRVK